MKMTATELRRNLFQALDEAAKGKAVEIKYKGKDFQLVVRSGLSKLARAIKRDTLLVDPDSIISSDKELMAELEAKWAKEYEDL